jgi:hypothetical protein
MKIHNVDCADPNKKINGLGMNMDNVARCCNTSFNLFHPPVIFLIHSKICFHNLLHELRLWCHTLKAIYDAEQT